MYNLNTWILNEIDKCVCMCVCVCIYIYIYIYIKQIYGANVTDFVTCNDFLLNQ